MKNYAWQTTLFLFVFSFCALSQPPPPPDPPAHLYPGNGSTVSYLRVQLMWDEVYLAEAYNVQLSTDAIFSVILHDDTTTDRWSETDLLTISTDYYWRARTFNSMGVSDWSAPWKFTTLTPPAGGSGTAIVDGVVGTDEYSGAITDNLTLDLPGGGTTTAIVFEMSDNDNLYVAVQVPHYAENKYGWVDFRFLTDLSWPRHGDDALFLTYEDGGAQWFGDNVTFSTPPCPENSLCVNFDSSLGGTQDGQGMITRNDSMDTFEISHPLRSGDTGHDFHLAPGDYHGFLTYGGFSDGVNFPANYINFGGFVIPLPSPLLVSPPHAAVDRPTNPSLKWTAVFGATGYKIQVGRDSLFNSMVFDDSTTSDTSAIVNGLAHDSTYYWRVRAFRPGLVSAYSAVRRFTTVTEPPAAVLLDSPADGSTGIDPIVTFRWLAAGRAGTYRLQVSADPAFLSTHSDDSLLVDTFLVVNGLSYETVYHWRVRAENAGGTGPWSETRTFTTRDAPLAAPVLAGPGDGAEGVTLPVTFSWNPVALATGYRLTVSSDPSFLSVVFDDTVVTDTQRVVTGLSYGTAYYWRVSGRLDALPGPWSEVRTFTAAKFSIATATNWNLVSVPLTGGDYAVATVFPTAATGAYSFEPAGGGYAEASGLVGGRGYWIKFSNPGEAELDGAGVTVDSIGIEPGWNLIGSLCAPVQVGAIVSDPPGLMTSQFYAYDGGYSASSTVQPGKGYWVKASGAGILILSTASSTSAPNRIVIRDRGEVPPPPPGADVASGDLPATYALSQNYPNPFNPTTTIAFSMPVRGRVRLSVYNLVGQEVAVLVDAEREAGVVEVLFDADELPSGVYICRMAAGDFTAAKRMVLLK